MPFITGENIDLDHCEGCEGIVGDILNDARVRVWRGPKAFPYSMSDMVKSFEKFRENGDLYLYIFNKDHASSPGLFSNRSIVGTIKLNSIDYLNSHAEVSFLIFPDQWGKGYASEAINLITNHAFKSMNLHRVYGESPNPGACRAMEKAGFILEGTKKEAFYQYGEFLDVKCYAKIRPF